MRILELIGKCFTVSPDVEVSSSSPRRSHIDHSPTNASINLLGYDAATITKASSVVDTEDKEDAAPASRRSSISLADLANAHDLASDAASAADGDEDWSMDWKTINGYAALRTDSVTDSDVSSVKSRASSIGSCATDSEAVALMTMPEGTETPVVPSPPLSTASNRNLKLFSTGVSYRQLTQELAPPTDEETAAAFYRVALEKLKQERALRVRLRSESGSEFETDMETDSETETAEPEEDDEMRRLRKQKLDSLRQRSTNFAITIGKPLNYISFTDLPDDNGSYFV